jgi:hypothetical protein
MTSMAMMLTDDSSRNSSPPVVIKALMGHCNRSPIHLYASAFVVTTSKFSSEFCMGSDMAARALRGVVSACRK